MITEEQDGTLTPLTAAIVVSAVGLFEVLRFPDISGISASLGDNFHTARWDNSVSLAGKRVAVIGSGASA
jgi:4-hydroxyacetophenone monooxygenase